MEPSQILIAVLCLALGGVLKGATGAGAPVVAVPALAAMFDVRFAIVVMLVPNLLTNVWQAWLCRRDRLDARFVVPFAGAGAAGVVIGTFALASLAPEALSVVVAISVFIFIALRLARPAWILRLDIARRLALPVGFAAGALHGASGISAPVSLSFLNAMRLERRVFMGTVSVFFAAMTAAQIPTTAAFGLIDLPVLFLSLMALLPIVGAMPVGAFLARRLSRDVFDRVMLAMLAVLAVKLIVDAVIGH